MAADTGEHAARLPHMLARRGDRYGLLLLLLVFSYVISAFTTTNYTSAAATLLFLLTLLLALRTSGVHKRTMQLIMGITLAGTRHRDRAGNHPRHRYRPRHRRAYGPRSSCSSPWA